MSETIVKCAGFQVNQQEQQLAEMHCDLIKSFLLLLYVRVNSSISTVIT